VAQRRTGRELRSFAATLASIAQRKTAAGHARRAGTPPGGERPRELFLRAADAVAARIAPSGFRYARSGPHATRRSGGLSYQLSFGSSHNNVAGAYVAFKVAALVSSSELRAWRRAQPRSRGDSAGVTASSLNGLMDEPGWIEWNLAAADPDDAVDDICSHIERWILPWFAWFERPDELAARLTEGDLPAFSGASPVEYLLSIGRRDAAMAHARWWLGRDPETEARVRSAVRAYERGERPLDVASWPDHPDELARTLVLYRLPPWPDSDQHP
jgi:hypothetical protein